MIDRVQHKEKGSDIVGSNCLNNYLYLWSLGGPMLESGKHTCLVLRHVIVDC